MTEVIAETERLILRTWRQEDRAVYLATCNTEAVTAHLGGPAAAEDIDAAFARIAKSQSEHGFSFWAIERKADGALLGYCGPRICDDLERPVHGELEIGWRLREDAWGQGYGVESARAFVGGGGGKPHAPRLGSLPPPAHRPNWRRNERRPE